VQGGWIGEAGVYSLLHQWGRISNLALQRFPVALANTLLVVFIFLYVRRLFGARVALVAAVLISLDPFYLSDSRVNRAEALVTGLMMLALLGLIGWLRDEGRRHLFVSGVFGGLAMLTKSQAVVLVPVLGTASLLWYLRNATHWWTAIRLWSRTMLVWGLPALC
jgi:4-amino-4-deoxy-L-arabinose transferase-like glycosyltransferase